MTREGELGAPGTHGGNLDLRELAEGSTLYLPVWQRGGLIYTGASHAVQGDGRRHYARRAR
jgi:acetamidase/formamidase